jgi:subtilisin family serine protease
MKKTVSTSPGMKSLACFLVCILALSTILLASAGAAVPNRNLTAETVPSTATNRAAFHSSPYVREHTTTLSSRPGIAFAKGILAVQFEETAIPEQTRGSRFVTGVRELDELMKDRGLQKAERLFPWDCESGGSHCSFFRLTFPEDTDLESLLRELEEAPGVLGVDPVGVHPVDHYPDDFWFPVQWPLNQGDDHDMNAPECWDVEEGDSSIVVAIIDTGVDWEHPDLGGAAPYTGGNVWTNWSEFYGTDGNDDDNNGFVDDYRGWDFVNGVTGAPGEDAFVPDNDPMDFFGHGTHVAGIVGAIGDNGEGVAGLAYGCKVMPVRAGWWAAGSGGVVRMDFCAQGVYYAARNGARIINCSWANDSSGGLDVAADTAAARGAIIVVSAGNGSTSSQAINYLSTRPDCFAVAATDSSDLKSSTSNYGTWVDYCAPGESVPSTFRRGTGPHTYAWMTGTSMAAPYVSALSALLLSQDPSLTRAQVRTIIRNTCDPIDDLNPGYGGLLGAGRINAYAALSRGTGDWQARTDGEVNGSPLPFEDGSFTYVAVTSADSCLHLIDSDGDAVSGWPKCVTAELSSPAAGDIDGGGDAELLAGSGTGDVYAWTSSGGSVPGWPTNVGEAVVSGPMLCDLDEDANLEVVVATADSTLHVLRGNGSPQPDWPVAMSGAVTSEPCFAFVSADTVAVVLVATSDARVHALKSDGTEQAGWPITVGSVSPGSPVALDMDTDGRSEIFLAASDGTVYGVDDDGSQLAGWPRSAGAGIGGSVALGDVDGDGFPDVVAGSSDGRVYAWSLTGQPLPGWPAAAGTSIVSSPSLVDLNGDGACEVAVGSEDRNFHVWSGATAGAFAGWPRSTGGPISSSPCFWDFDGDGSLEVALGSGDQKVHFWQLTGSLAVDSLMAWSMYRHDAHRSGNSGFEIELPVPPSAPGLVVNVYPNPFAGTVTFECSVAGGVTQSGGKRGTVSLYDVSGRRLAELPVSGNGNTLSLNWNGTNQAARELASGVYFYAAEVDGLKSGGKVVFFRE